MTTNDATPPVRRTVLVVDDDELGRRLVCGTLGPIYEVLEADNGRAALELLGRRRVDLVLLDVMMPELNGLDLCREIKARHRDDFLPVVLLTALDGQEDRNAGFDAGADDFLTKPIHRRELVLRVRALVRIREQEEKLRAKEELVRDQLGELKNLQGLKDDLFSLIVHDLRNPLTGVVGFLELLQGGLTEPSQARLREDADRAHEAALKLQGLLEEVLEVQRLEAGGIPLDLERASLGAIALDAARTLEGAAKSRGITIDVAVEGAPTLSLDRTLIRRAVENLIANALRFSPASHRVIVTVRSSHGSVQVDVADGGPGTSDTTKARLFKKFASVESRLSGVGHRGFGLGLHLVKLVATAHGGNVFVRDNQGGGSVFGLSFPEAAP